MTPYRRSLFYEKRGETEKLFANEWQKTTRKFRKKNVKSKEKKKKAINSSVLCRAHIRVYNVYLRMKERLFC